MTAWTTVNHYRFTNFLRKNIRWIFNLADFPVCISSQHSYTYGYGQFQKFVCTVFKFAILLKVREFDAREIYVFYSTMKQSHVKNVR